MHRYFRFCLVLAASAFALAAHAQSFALVAHPGVTESSLSADDVSSILLGKKTNWSAGTIKLAVLTEGAAHEAVMKAFTQRSADQFDKHWKKLVFTGKGIMPASFKTDAELLDYVAKTPGAFGYVAAENVSDQVKALPTP